MHTVAWIGKKIQLLSAWGCSRHKRHENAALHLWTFLMICSPILLESSLRLI